MDEFKNISSLGDLGIKLGFYTRGQLRKALEVQADRKEKEQFDRLGDVLLELGYITEENLQILLDRQRKTVSGKNRIGRYELVKEIGRGGMGIVYKAKQTPLDRFVALKVIQKGVALDAEFRERFLRESRLAAKLTHPNIIKAIDAGETQQHYFFAMELFESPDLLQIMKKKGEPIEEKIVAKVGAQMCSALEHAETNHLIHRDIKPENILYDSVAGMSKLTDMGLAKSTQGEKGDLTQAGSTLGTPFYISPEAIAAKRTVDIRSDLYSLGATMYHLLTKRVPFDGDTIFVILKKHTSEPVTPPKRINPKISAEMNRILLKALTKNPDKRYQSPKEMRGDLERLVNLGPTRAFADYQARGTAVRKPGRRKKRRDTKTALFAVVGLVLVVAAIALVLVAANPGDGKKGKSPADEGEKAPARTKGDRGPSKKPPVEPVPKPPPDEPPDEETDEDRFERIGKYAASHPDNFGEIISRYKDLATRTQNPELAGRCTEQAAAWEKRRIGAQKAALDAELRVAENLRNKLDFGGAINTLNALATRLPKGEDLDRVRNLKDRYWGEARAKVSQFKALARRLARKGLYNEARRKIEEIESFGLPTLWKSVEDLVRKYRDRELEARAVAFHNRIRTVVAKEGAARAQKILENPGPEVSGPDVVFEKACLGKAEELRESLRMHFEGLRGRKTELALLSGKMLRGTLEEAGERGVVLRRPDGTKQSVALWELDPGVTGSGTPQRRFAEACFLWYFVGPAAGIRIHAELIGLAEEGIPEAGDLAEKVLAVVRMDLRETVEDLGDAPARKAFEKCREIILSFRDTPFYAAVESAATALFTRAAKTLGENADVHLQFRCPLTFLPNEVRRAVYDFDRSGELNDFETAGAGKWVVSRGALRQSAAAGVAEAVLSCRWADASVEAELSLDGRAPAAGLFLQKASGARVLLELGEDRGRCRLRLIRIEADRTSEKVLGKPLAIPASQWKKKDAVLVLRLETGGGKIRGSWAVPGASPKKMSASADFADVVPGLCAPAPVSFLRVTCEGTLAASWLGEVVLAGRLRSEFARGRWTKLLAGGGSLAGFRTRGKVEAKAETVVLSGERSDLTFTAARRAFGPGRNFQCAFSARRNSDLGWAALRFTVGSRDVIWVLRPEMDETPPYGVPEEHAVISTGPFADGKWHEVTLEVTDTNARMYVDGIQREDYNIDMLKELQGDIETEGFGVSAFGGTWEFKELRVRKLKK
jgi:serine/threonine-protein kinase